MTADDKKHPDDETLARYTDSALGGDEADAVAAHLGACPRCSERVLDALEPLAASEPTDAEVTAGVDAVMARVTASRSPADSARRVSWGWLAAAALLVLAAGLALQSLRLSGLVDQVGRLAQSEPIADAPVIDLLPPGVLRSADSIRSAVRVAADEPLLILLITPSEPRPAASARLLIIDAAGTERWRGDLLANEAGSFSLAVHAGFLPVGRYDLVLQPAAGQDTVSTQYTLEVVAAADPER